jgi:hypothetical protein
MPKIRLEADLRPPFYGWNSAAQPERLGFESPVICSPEELGGGGEP